MNYKFNNGYGAVLCDKCRIIVDEGLNIKEAKELYGDGEVLCRDCMVKQADCMVTDTVKK